MPPVFIVVCYNTQVSKLIFDWIARYEKPVGHAQSVLVPGSLVIVSNGEDHGAEAIWSHRPNTLYIDRQQVDSGEAPRDEFKQVVASEIAEFKAEIRERFSSLDPDKLFCSEHGPDASVQAIQCCRKQLQ